MMYLIFRYYELKKAYQSMVKYHKTANVNDAKRAINKLYQAAICDHQTRCPHLKGKMWIDNPTEQKCTSAGCCWNDESFAERQKTGHYQCSARRSNPGSFAGARSYVPYNRKYWIQFDDKTWAIKET